PEKPQYRTVGTRPVRPDGVDKVTGRAQYGADVHLEGLLYGAMLRSPHAHARIKRIDTSKAEALPGVHAVVTQQDFPEPPEGRFVLGEERVSGSEAHDIMLAGEKVLYDGH